MHKSLGDCVSFTSTLVFDHTLHKTVSATKTVRRYDSGNYLGFCFIFSTDNILTCGKIKYAVIDKRSRMK